ncbi:MAG: acyl-CoA dehydrogenase family protein [Candidatus Binatus sp.]|uniref:acyl-CoA dehydrogenase family protein n=1 Tax=Candidatus Binatus sp. TaxID=2811406 RepID=UPI0027171693|nr:acyl-CoA dehydrogenase family protein [Candidatus Binatus sp.]MDO8431157.1 acyl-CoA dehydrogenase family protein [Candidatus Binatus sp.]
MDFKFSEADEAFRLEFRSWLEKNIPRDWRDEDELADPDTKSEFERRRTWHRKLHDGGWMCIHWPAEYGGRGATLLQQVIYNQEIDRAKAPPTVNFQGIARVGPTLMQWGTPAQKKRFIPKIPSAEEIWCQGLSEPNHGSDLAAVETRAIDKGDYFLVNGSKVWTSNAHHADFSTLLCRTDPEQPKHKGLSYLLVSMKSAGVTVRPLVQITGEHGFNQVFFEDVQVPKENLVGKKNEGWLVAITNMMFERTIHGGRTDMMIEVKQLATLAARVELRGRPAIMDSYVRQHLASFACEAEALKYTSFRQLTRQLRGLPPGPEGSVMKLGTTDLNLRIQKFAMELLGAYSQFEYQAAGAIDRGKWSHRMLAARRGTIAAGTNEIQHNIIGERVLGLPKG